MTPQDRRLLAAFLRCAAASDMHKVTGELAPNGRLNNAAWAEFYRYGSAQAAADGLERELAELERRRCEAADEFAARKPVEYGLAELREVAAIVLDDRFDLGGES